MKKLLLAGFASFLSVAATQAAPIAAGTVFNIGGVTFSDFSCSSGTNQGTTAGGCGTLEVFQSGTTGIQFVGGLQAVSAATPGGSTSLLDTLIGYQVSSSSPLSNVALSFNGDISGPGIATAEVIESIALSRNNPAVLAQTRVNTLNPPSSRNATLAFPAGLTSAFLTKDILLTTFPGAGGLTISSISLVTQTLPGSGGGGGTPVPEPMSLALLGAGLIGLGMVRRAKRS